jgi:hypothetical protein
MSTITRFIALSYRADTEEGLRELVAQNFPLRVDLHRASVEGMRGHADEVHEVSLRVGDEEPRYVTFDEAAAMAAEA